ncbi:hypothetical protein [Pseudarthrobacter sp. NPDC080039]|uniref:hypothetical protein n=2 Tax=unclassified Pseudarthrobacter TaxID=2647000 RepID=UPI003450841E
MTLIAVDRQGTRHLRNAAGSIDCKHFTARQPDHSTRGGGPMSAEHLWYQQEIAKQVGRRPHLRVTIEDYASNADLVIFNTETSRSIAVEIQRWDTDIAERTKHRLSLGHEVIWLITDSAQLSPDMQRQVFTTRGAFIRVRTFDKPYLALHPWELEPKERRAKPVMEVSGTTVGLNPLTGCLQARPMPLMQVLVEILDGKREWLFPGEAIFKGLSGAGRKGGAWARNIDYVNAHIRASKLDIPLVPETSRYGRTSTPIARPQSVPGDNVP